MARLEDLIELSRAGLLVPTTSRSRTTEWHREKFLELAHASAATADVRKSFVLRYDALMRLVEASTSRVGFEFGESAHEAMRRCVHLAAPSVPFEDLRLLSKARHAAKKEGVHPPGTAVELLEQLIAIAQQGSSS